MSLRKGSGKVPLDVYLRRFYKTMHDADTMHIHISCLPMRIEVRLSLSFFKTSQV